ncbi:MAG: hypothetical protein WCJ62_00070 [Flavobacterium sp.]
MPNYIDNNTQIPAARVKMNDEATGFVNRPWYRWFFNMYQAVEAGRRYGSFYSTVTQTAAAINTGYGMMFNTTGSNYGVYVGTTTSQIFVDNTATYNIQFTAQLSNTAVTAQNIYTWLRVNGTTSTSAAKILVAASSTAAAVAARNFVINLTAGDYFEIMWSTDNTGVRLSAVAASSPVPAIPSVNLTVTSSVGV